MKERARKPGNRSAAMARNSWRTQRGHLLPQQPHGGAGAAPGTHTTCTRSLLQTCSRGPRVTPALQNRKIELRRRSRVGAPSQTFGAGVTPGGQNATWDARWSSGCLGVRPSFLLRYTQEGAGDDKGWVPGPLWEMWVESLASELTCLSPSHCGYSGK